MPFTHQRHCKHKNM